MRKKVLSEHMLGYLFKSGTHMLIYSEMFLIFVAKYS